MAGERRRTEIGEAPPQIQNFILLDEPFAGVDPIAAEDIQIAGKEAQRQKHRHDHYTDHNVHETLSITDRTIDAGSVMKSGTADDLANDEMVAQGVPWL